MTTPSFRALLASERPLVLPGAHDALSARLIEQAGFKGIFVGGFALVGSRYGVPDIGLMGFAEIGAGVRDIREACRLPLLVDADDGYGDVKNVTRTVHAYERMGVAALFLEDQAAPKRCGHLAGKALVPAGAMADKIRAALAARENPETFIIARTDARTVLGLDEALRRGERYLKAGADGLFIESPLSVAELAIVGRAFDAPQLASMLEGGRTPILRPSELGAMGFRIVIYGTTLLMRAAEAMRLALDDLKSERMALFGTGMGFDDYFRLTRLADWARIEDDFRRGQGNS
ncbi:MAG: isocitrate lyase/PEP mutase family protein [Proteobacteria bacterium]|nr:isocitrate lyase/PEP mutase family protein [Pseudomonadota bacterium]